MITLYRLVQPLFVATFAACLLACETVKSAEGSSGEDPKRFVSEALRLSADSDSVLPSNENRLLQFFDSTLQELFLRAAKMDRAFSTAHPDEKPPFVEFDPFRPLPDAHESATVIAALSGSPENHTMVAVEFLYRYATPQAPGQFSILVVFRIGRESNGEFVIHDITTFDPRPSVGNRSLREELSLALRTAAIAD